MRIDFLNIRIRLGFSVSKTVEVIGINSNVDAENKEHILLWDFDNIPYSEIVESLKSVQRFFVLPTIHVITSSPEHYHAYCFAKFPQATAMYIIGKTSYVDTVFFRFGILRNYWTLRITSKKHGQTFCHVGDLPSDVPEDLSCAFLLDTIRYRTGVGV